MNSLQEEEQFEVTIGLEVHCQLATRSKIFCGCAIDPDAPPNSLTCPVCLGLPGALPVLNERVVDLAVMAALAVGCRVHPVSQFDRKNYFYPDLPKGYQITQYDRPFATGGSVAIHTEDGPRNIPLTRIHLEEDAGKSIHDGEHGSLVDLNRAGTPLIEVVSEPALSSSGEAVAYLKALHAIVTTLGVCDGNMEKGNFRCDANVSIRKKGEGALGTRVELKNLNSFRFLGKAIDHEVDRQISAVRAGETIRQQTRQWDSERNRSVVMRDKEDAHDYRYFPEPDLRLLFIPEVHVEQLRQSLSELPGPRAVRFMGVWGLTRMDAEVLTSSRELADFFEQTVAAGGDARSAANWIRGEVLAYLNREGIGLTSSPVTPTRLAERFQLVSSGTLSLKMARRVFEEMATTGASPGLLVQELGLVQVHDVGALENAIDAVINAFPTELQAFRSGKEKVFGFFVGKVMKQTEGQANPVLVNEILRKKLEG